MNTSSSISTSTTYGSIPNEQPKAQQQQRHISFSDNDDNKDDDDESVQHSQQRNNKQSGSSLTRHWWFFQHRFACAAAAGLVIVLLVTVTAHTIRLSNIAKNNVNNNKPLIKSISDSEAAAAAAAAADANAAIPLYYREQLVDHIGTYYNQNQNNQNRFFAMKYFEDKTYFGGPGYPLFVQIGGEDPKDGLGKPFIYKGLAKQYKAYNLGIEHRFFGDSWPVPYDSNSIQNADLHALLTVEQALHDFLRFIQVKQRELGCGRKGSAEYCPVLVIGCSYPGFLVTLLRLHFDHVVDMAYASSAPIYLYSHNDLAVHPDAYYEKITMVTEKAGVKPGCASAVRSTWISVRDDLLKTSTTDDLLKIAYNQLGICKGSIPEYLLQTNNNSSRGNNSLFAQELLIVLATHFADANMAYYPPTENEKENLELTQLCQVFQNSHFTPYERVYHFLKVGFDENEDNDSTSSNTNWCFDMSSQVPPGPNGTVACSDWSGCDGKDPASHMWDYLACTLAPECGLSAASMLPERPWTLDWFQQHCMDRFEYEAIHNLRAIHDQFPFTDLFEPNKNVTRLLFTNGLNDGWSVASVVGLPDGYTKPSSKSGITVINFPNGAHHSELRDIDYDLHDTPDVRAGHAQIIELVGVWLEEIRVEQQNNNNQQQRH